MNSAGAAAAGTAAAATAVFRSLRCSLRRCKVSWRQLWMQCLTASMTEAARAMGGSPHALEPRTEEELGFG